MTRVISLLISILFLGACSLLPTKIQVYTKVKTEVVEKKVLVPFPILVPTSEPIILRHMHFATDKWTLNQSVQRLLEGLAAALTKEYKDIHVRIEGHADHRGTHWYNLQLSKKRAAAVAMFLIHRGVEDFRLEARGYGETQRIDTTETEEGMQRNRRVEIHFIGCDSCQNPINK